MRTGRNDNRGVAAPPAGTLSSEAACARLGVKKATLYSYASRGLLRRVGAGRRCFYSREDVERLAVRSEARRGHAAVASGALRWGEPVLDSAITSIVEGRLRYRGQDALRLARERSFEQVCDLLWRAEPGRWPSTRASKADENVPVWRMIKRLPELALADSTRLAAAQRVEHARARRLVTTLAATLGARGTGPLALRLSRAFGASTDEALDATLILCADHELNVSSFAARVAASAGADLYACVGAALYVFSGPRHGGACDRVEALARERGARVLRERSSRGESLPGFGHPLYPDGDPRALPLLDLARGRRPTGDLRRLFDRVEEGAQLGLRPTVDLGVVAVALSLGAPRGTASGLFALGRLAGWVAHVLEQRTSPGLLRPRARYVGE